jgi:signal transduction histidine kinase
MTLPSDFHLQSERRGNAAPSDDGVDPEHGEAPEVEASILIVDDRPANLLAYEAVLAPLGYHLIKASSGREALERLAEGEFALVLLDVQMPELDGFETASLIQARPPAKRVPIIFVTATSRDLSQIFQGYSSGAVDFLYKPIDPEILRCKARIFVELFRKAERLKRQEALLREHARERVALAAAREAVRLRDDFLSIASHELNTPLTPIKLQLAMLRRETSAAPLQARIDDVEKQVDRFADLVTRLLDVSRIAAGRLTLEPEVVNLGRLLRDVVERNDAEATANGCALHLDLQDTAEGLFDRLRIGEAISNLVSNAVKYGKGHPVDLSLRVEGGIANIRVRDHGIGIEPSWHARIFERFARVSPARHSGGFGLGLWIVRQVVEASGGTVDVESRLGAGSTFRIALPLRLGG